MQPIPNERTLRGSPPPMRIFTPGRLLVLLELYLVVAAQLAFGSDVLIAPPVLIFLIADHWLPLGLVAAFVCGIELAYFRTRLAALAFVVAIAFVTAPLWLRMASLL